MGGTTENMTDNTIGTDINMIQCYQFYYHYVSIHAITAHSPPTTTTSSSTTTTTTTTTATTITI